MAETNNASVPEVDSDKLGRRCGACRNYGHYKSKCPYVGTILGQGFNFISVDAAVESANAAADAGAAPVASSAESEAPAASTATAKKRGRKAASSAAADPVASADETIEVPAVSTADEAGDAAEHNLLTHTSASSSAADAGAQRSKKLRPTSERTTGTHTPQHVTALAAEKSVSGVNKYRRRVCAVCRKESSFICVQCKVGLHIGCDDASNCWRTYHSDEWA